jgi:hypothetical protein
MNKKFDLEIYDFGKKYDLEKGWGYFIKATDCTNCVLNYIKGVNSSLLLSKVYLNKILGKGTLEEAVMDSLKTQEVEEVWGIEKNMDIADYRCYEKTILEMVKEYEREAKEKGYEINKVLDKSSRGSKL